MSLDARVKGALERSSQIVDPDVRRNLSTVRRKTRRLALRQRIVTTVAVAALVALGVFLAPRIVDVIRNQRKVPANTPSSSLVGTYEADLSGTGGSIASAGVEGRWVITFAGDGAIVWNPPSGSGLMEGLPRDTYQVSGSSFSTNLFTGSLCRGAGVGTYAWARSGGVLTLLPTNDGCSIRRAILTSFPWRAP
jgi:hypothetical protein